MKVLKSILTLFGALAVLALSSCNRGSYEPFPEPSDVRRVMMMYCCGYNNLSSDIYDDIQELCTTLPDGRTEHFYKVIIFSHLTKPVGITRDDNDYVTPCNPVLIDAYKDKFGQTVLDTVKIYPADMISGSAEAVREVMNDVRQMFPAREYGMIMSSHGTGWLPNWYYDKKDKDDWIMFAPSPGSNAQRQIRMPLSSYSHPLEGPKVKSMMAQGYRIDGEIATYEMEVRDFAACLPYHLDYLVLDMCLMGGIELAYELAGKVDYLAFSPTEVLSGGFRYDTAVDRLLLSSKPDVAGFCDDYYHKYADSGRYASISLIDCNRLDNLASVCNSLFAKYHSQMMQVNPRQIQGYFRSSKHWFYDLRDVLVCSGIDRNERKALDNALSECVLYNQATEIFISIRINTHCGFSMYLPSNGDSYLDNFYKEYRWNKATSLVR